MFLTLLVSHASSELKAAVFWNVPHMLVTFLLAVTASGGHGMVWSSGLRAQRSWACEVAVEWARATVQSEAN